MLMPTPVAWQHMPAFGFKRRLPAARCRAVRPCVSAIAHTTSGMVEADVPVMSDPAVLPLWTMLCCCCRVSACCVRVPAALFGAFVHGSSQTMGITEVESLFLYDGEMHLVRRIGVRWLPRAALPRSALRRSKTRVDLMDRLRAAARVQMLTDSAANTLPDSDVYETGNDNESELISDEDSLQPLSCTGFATLTASTPADDSAWGHVSAACASAVDQADDALAATAAAAPAATDKLSALESELARLREQIAMIVITQQAQSVTSCFAPPPPPAPPMDGFSGGLDDGDGCCGGPPPPPPPPPPSLELLMPKEVNVIEQIRMNRQKNGAVGASAAGGDAKDPRANMMEVLKNIGSVKLKSVQRSPGGTPLRARPVESEPLDPASIIANALKKKFQKALPRSEAGQTAPHSAHASPAKSLAPCADERENNDDLASSRVVTAKDVVGHATILGSRNVPAASRPLRMR
jgi:hypothetical protein